MTTASLTNLAAMTGGYQPSLATCPETGLAVVRYKMGGQRREAVGHTPAEAEAVAEREVLGNIGDYLGACLEGRPPHQMAWEQANGERVGMRRVRLRQ